MASQALGIYYVTLNCGQSLINRDTFAADLFKPYRDRAVKDFPDVIVFSLQEIARMPYCFLGLSYYGPYIDRLLDSVREAGPESYAHFATRNAGMTAIVIIVKREIYERFTLIGEADVGVGLWGMGNKGAAGLRLGYSFDNGAEDISLTFVAAHLAAHETDVRQRNRDWENIVRHLVFTPPAPESPLSTRPEPEADPLIQGSIGSSGGIGGMFTPQSVVFFGGDLNYRTSDHRPDKDSYLSFPQPTDDVDDKKHYSHLFSHDQLLREKKANRTVHQLAEAPIDFPPTYKYAVDFYQHATSQARGSEMEPSSWQWATHRNPSWCDRILFSSFLEESSAIDILTYTALPIQPTTDHRPVALAMSLNLDKALKASIEHASEFKPPFPLNPQAQSLRAAARSREFLVGILAYLGMTWEGNGILLAIATGIVSAWFILGSFLRT